MLTTTLSSFIRRYLRDAESATTKGTFWQDDVILLAINQAQLQFCNEALRSEHRQLLQRLVTIATIPTPAAITTLPTNYMHAISASSGAALAPARLYLGATSVAYRTTDHHACHIYGTQYWFTSPTGTGIPLLDAGILSYYRYPTPFLPLITWDSILNGALALVLGNTYEVVSGTVVYNTVTYTPGQQFTVVVGVLTATVQGVIGIHNFDFQDKEYMLIAKIAAYHLGAKETDNSRDISAQKDIITTYSQMPKQGVWFGAEPRRS